MRLKTFLKMHEFEDKNAHVEIKQDSQSKEADLEQAVSTMNHLWMRILELLNQ
jgi:hypothetical protein